jgi:hypothetical protein
MSGTTILVDLAPKGARQKETKDDDEQEVARILRLPWPQAAEADGESWAQEKEELELIDVLGDLRKGRLTAAAKVAQVLTSVEVLGHCLFWARLEPGPELAVVELPRLQIAFDVRPPHFHEPYQDFVLESREITGYGVLAPSDEALVAAANGSKLQRGIFLTDLQTRTEGKVLMGTSFLETLRLPSAPRLVCFFISRDDEWRRCVTNRYCVGGLHISRLYLEPGSISCALQLAYRYALQYEYKLAHRYVSFALATDEALTEEESFSVGMLFDLDEKDKNPEFQTLLLRLAIYLTADQSTHDKKNTFFRKLADFQQYMHKHSDLEPGCRLSENEVQAVLARARDAPAAWKAIRAPDLALAKESATQEWRIGAFEVTNLESKALLYSKLEYGRHLVDNEETFKNWAAETFGA